MQRNWTLSPTKWDSFLGNLELDIKDLQDEMNNFISPSGQMAINASGFLNNADVILNSCQGYEINPSGVL